MPGLDQEVIAHVIKAEVAALEEDRHWVLQSAVVMPDHLHLLIRTMGDHSLSRCVARLKTKTRPSLSRRQLSWQPNFYEHRLRPEDSVETVIRYIFLNPYRDEVTPAGDSYQWFWLGQDEAAWFLPATDSDRPFPEWLV